MGGLALNNITQAAIQSLGWRWALRIAGFIHLVLIGIAAIFAYPLNPPAKRVALLDLSHFKNSQFVVCFLIQLLCGFTFFVSS